MDTIKSIAQFYNKRFAYHKTPVLPLNNSEYLKVSIVMPAFDENLEPTLESLENCLFQNHESIELIIVLNHSENESKEIKEKHLHQYEKYSSLTLKNGLKVQALKAFDLPKKHAGVGLARKIGMDEALKRFAHTGYDGLIVCLDADCEVSTNYLESLLKAESEKYSGLCLYYEHPIANIGNNAELSAIVDYEIFLRYYSLALKKTGYPHYYQTVGSSMASRSSTYAKVGGMNRRKAGEDFYFLHKVFPQGNFKLWNELTVFPSARKSERVPFGTGKAMIEVDKGNKDYSYLYHPKIFSELEGLLGSLSSYYEGVVEISNIIKSFLGSEGLEEQLEDLKKRSSGYKSFENNFFHWFDGFKVLKYLHFARDEFYKDIINLEACQQMLNTKSVDNYELLIELRNMEKEA